MLDPNDTANTGKQEGNLPMFLENMKDAFLGPFQAVSESFSQAKEGVKNTGELMKILRWWFS